MGNVLLNGWNGAGCKGLDIDLRLLFGGALTALRSHKIFLGDTENCNCITPHATTQTIETPSCSQRKEKDTHKAIQLMSNQIKNINDETI